jgi:hypothetical protein
MTEATDPGITDSEIRDIAVSSGFTVREQPDGDTDLNPYVYEFARTLIKRARGVLHHPVRNSKFVLVVKVDRRTGATVAYDAAVSVVEAVNRWQAEMGLASGMDLLEEITEAPVMWGKVLANNLDDAHSYLMVRGNELSDMGATINALIHKRWPSETSITNPLTRDDIAQLADTLDEPLRS